MDRQIITAIVRAIVSLDQVSFSIPNTENGQKVKEARNQLMTVLRREGYVMTEMCSTRVRKMTKAESSMAVIE